MFFIAGMVMHFSLRSTHEYIDALFSVIKYYMWGGKRKGGTERAGHDIIGPDHFCELLRNHAIYKSMYRHAANPILMSSCAKRAKWKLRKIWCTI